MVPETALSREDGLETRRGIIEWLDPFAVGAFVPTYLTHVRAMDLLEDRGHINPTGHRRTIDNVQEISQLLRNSFDIPLAKRLAQLGKFFLDQAHTKSTCCCVWHCWHCANGNIKGPMEGGYHLLRIAHFMHLITPLSPSPDCV